MCKQNVLKTPYERESENFTKITKLIDEIISKLTELLPIYNHIKQRMLQHGYSTRISVKNLHEEKGQTHSIGLSFTKIQSNLS